MLMVRLVYKTPLCEKTGAEQPSVLCQSTFNGERSFDPLQDAFGDWDSE